MEELIPVFEMLHLIYIHGHGHGVRFLVQDNAGFALSPCMLLELQPQMVFGIVTFRRRLYFDGFVIINGTFLKDLCNGSLSPPACAFVFLSWFWKRILRFALHFVIKALQNLSFSACIVCNFRY